VALFSRTLKPLRGRSQIERNATATRRMQKPQTVLPVAIALPGRSFETDSRVGVTLRTALAQKVHSPKLALCRRIAFRRERFEQLPRLGMIATIHGSLCFPQSRISHLRGLIRISSQS
jgi:hypothetical protein